VALNRWVLDTDVLSLMYREQLPEELRRTIFDQPLGVTYVQIGELSRWVRSRNWGLDRSKDLQVWVSRFPVLNSNTSVSRKWGEIVSNAYKRGRPRSVNDSWVAACCISYRVPLVTRNKRDFADFAAFEGLELIDVGGVK
jgi:predicted nucleic acid-binding protein